MDAVILAGGKGTRLRPLTDTLPKPLVPFMGEPYAAGLLRRLVAVGVRRATFLVGRDPEPWAPLAAIGAGVGVTVDVVTEEEPLDTAGAARRVLRGRAAADGPVLVCNGDILTDLDLGAVLAAHEATGATATIALTRVEDTSAYGVVVCDGTGRVQRFVEKPAPGALPDDTVNAGTYVLAPDALDAFPGDGPLSFERTVFPGLVAAGAVVLGHPSDAYWADLGTPARYLAGHRAVLEGRCAWPPAPGMGPVVALASVHETARIAASAQVGPGSVVGAHCELRPGCALRDVVLHEGVVVGEDATVQAAVIGARARVAAGAVLGPGEVVASDGLVTAPAARLGTSAV